MQAPTTRKPSEDRTMILTPMEQVARAQGVLVAARRLKPLTPITSTCQEFATTAPTRPASRLARAMQSKKEMRTASWLSTRIAVVVTAFVCRPVPIRRSTSIRRRKLHKNVSSVSRELNRASRRPAPGNARAACGSLATGMMNRDLSGSWLINGRWLCHCTRNMARNPMYFMCHRLVQPALMRMAIMIGPGHVYRMNTWYLFSAIGYLTPWKQLKLKWRKSVMGKNRN